MARRQPALADAQRLLAKGPSLRKIPRRGLRHSEAVQQLRDRHMIRTESALRNLPGVSPDSTGVGRIAGKEAQVSQNLEGRHYVRVIGRVPAPQRQ